MKIEFWPDYGNKLKWRIVCNGGSVGFETKKEAVKQLKEWEKRNFDLINIPF